MEPDEYTISSQLLDMMVDAIAELPYHRAAPILEVMGGEIASQQASGSAPQIVMTPH